MAERRLDFARRALELRKKKTVATAIVDDRQLQLLHGTSDSNDDRRQPPSDDYRVDRRDDARLSKKIADGRYFRR